MAGSNQTLKVAAQMILHIKEGRISFVADLSGAYRLCTVNPDGRFDVALLLGAIVRTGELVHFFAARNAGHVLGPRLTRAPRRRVIKPTISQNGGSMKQADIVGIHAVALSATLLLAGLPGYAQSSRPETPDHAHKHHHYQLIDLGTFGGPNSGLPGSKNPSIQVVRSRVLRTLLF